LKRIAENFRSLASRHRHCHAPFVLCVKPDRLLDAGIEELEKIRREDDSQVNTIATTFGFARYYLRVPNYLRVAGSYAVEIKIAHKQRAVGNQAMVYVNLPLKYCKSQDKQSLIGRCANKLEEVDYVTGQKLE
jgi:hypothetical protein